MNFVFLSLQRIGTDRESTSTGLAKELAKNHRVLYVNPPINRKTLYSKSNDKYTLEHIKAIKENAPPLYSLSSNLHVLNVNCIIESINWIPNTSIFCFFNNINNRKIAREIKKALSALEIDEFVLINDKDMFNSFYLKEFLKPKAYIYLDRDNTVVMDYWKKHGTKLEPQLMSKADAVVCNSYDFQKRAKEYNKNSFYIGNGVDLKLFNPEQTYETPIELRNIEKPIIGYVGALLSMRLDLKLILTTAKSNPEMSFVFIGPEDEDFAKSELHSLQNVYFLGKRHKNIVPAYINFFDVCINPQIVNEITIGNFPLKIVEYLALGKPVVAIETNTMKELFTDVVYLAKNQDEFGELLKMAIIENTETKRDKRIKFTRKFDWSEVAQNVLDVIYKINKN